MKYRVEGGVAVFGTDLVLVLDEKQVDARRHRLDRVEGIENGYRPNSPVQFKDGETIGVECKPSDLPGSVGRFLVAEGETETAAQSRKSTGGKSAAKKAA